MTNYLDCLSKSLLYQEFLCVNTGSCREDGQVKELLLSVIEQVEKDVFARNTLFTGELS